MCISHSQWFWWWIWFVPIQDKFILHNQCGITKRHERCELSRNRHSPRWRWYDRCASFIITEPRFYWAECRLTLAFLCNPNDEDTSLRGNHTSELFSDVLDDEYDCELIFPMSTAQTNCRFSDVFMNDLTVESIDWAIACFQDGIKSRAVLPSDFDPRRAQLACSRIYRLTEKGSTAMTSMYDIPNFWINLNSLIQNSNLNAMGCCITRVFC